MTHTTKTIAAPSDELNELNGHSGLNAGEHASGPQLPAGDDISCTLEAYIPGPRTRRPGGPDEPWRPWALAVVHARLALARRNLRLDTSSGATDRSPGTLRTIQTCTRILSAEQDRACGTGTKV